MRIVFFGTPQFAATILEHLIDSPFEIVAVISRPDKPKGRSGTPQPTAVKELAERYQLPVYQPLKASDPEFVSFLEGLQPDLFVVAAYAEILRQNLLDVPPLGCLNVHGSLLPKYRGAAPVQRALMDGESETGVAIMKMVRKMDAGDVYKLAKIPINLEMTAGDLFDTMAPIGAKALVEVIHQLEKGEATATPQDESQVTFAAKVSPEDGLIDWNKNALELHNQIRGLTPNPGAWCMIEVRGAKKRFRVKKTVPLMERSGTAGHILPEKGRLLVACGEGALELLEVQLEGKKGMEASVFVRGITLSDLKF